MLQGTPTTAANYLIKQLPKATAFINTKFEVVYVSDRWITDFDFGKRNVLGKSIFDLFDTVSDDLKDLLESCLIGSGGDSGVERFTDRSQKERWFEWTNIPWFDDRENIIGIIIQAEEVTQRVLQAEKLRKLELLLQNKSEVAGIGSWEYDTFRQTLHWCPTIKKIKGVADDYIPTAESAIEFYKEGFSRNTIAMAVENAKKNGTPWHEKLEMTTADGRDIWVIAAGKPLYRDGKYIGLLGTLQEITDHVNSENKIKESESLLRTVIDNLPLNLYIKDIDSRKTLVNRSECEYLGVSDPNEILGKSDHELYDKEVADISRQEDLAVMRSLTPIYGKETLNVTPNGNATTFLTSKIPLIGNDGRATGLMGISLDISNLKKQESELRNLINVTSLQNKKLVNFAHIVSHNLRSHTANFSMLLDFLKDEKDEAEKDNILRMLIAASNNLLETLENLNEVVSINTNVNLDKKPVKLYEKANTIVDSLSGFLKDSDAKIQNLISPDQKVKVVPAYLDSILMNFITNAVKYRDPSRIPVITLSTEKTNNFTVLSISDNGLGIDLKRYGEKLFGMYKTFHENDEARGIGLYITKNQVEAMGGFITTSSEVGKGTTFKIHFNDKD
ncbi:PAS domain-containing protein [Zeaxanthinibacter sp. PT1]|uniref:PAS domain-containing sensor histidine kinase n=1 Tax=Zeaxanthinibacter TaxID=561554 RepID=UPI00234A8810|nr:PAS domain-containing protein [Zeaxanthinibacter sp. PT1]MDC6351819.1 PAS domain-containing protein [Zeaxanthinibacter sp. PT1]